MVCLSEIIFPLWGWESKPLVCLQWVGFYSNPNVCFVGVSCWWCCVGLVLNSVGWLVWVVELGIVAAVWLAVD